MYVVNNERPARFFERGTVTRGGGGRLDIGGLGATLSERVSAIGARIQNIRNSIAALSYPTRAAAEKNIYVDYGFDSLITAKYNKILTSAQGGVYNERDIKTLDDPAGGRLVQIENRVKIFESGQQVVNDAPSANKASVLNWLSSHAGSGVASDYNSILMQMKSDNVPGVTYPSGGYSAGTQPGGGTSSATTKDDTMKYVGIAAGLLTLGVLGYIALR